MHEAHAFAAAAVRRFDEHRIADARCGGARFIDRPRGAAGRNWDAGLRHLLACGGLRSHRLHRARRRTDERDAGALARRGEFAVLAEETVAGMDRFGAALLGGGEDLVDAEITV